MQWAPADTQLVKHKIVTAKWNANFLKDALDECDAAAEMLKCSMETNEEMAKDLIRAVQENAGSDVSTFKALYSDISLYIIIHLIIPLLWFSQSYCHLKINKDAQKNLCVV
jgi:hypothetical protein